MLAAFFIASPSISLVTGEVSVIPHERYKETNYVIMGADGKNISLTVFHTDLNEMVLRLRNDSTLKMAEQLPLMEKLLEKVNADRPISSFRTLYVGTILFIFGKDKTISNRLIAASKPYAPVPFVKQNNLVRDMMNKKMLYPELKALFDKYGVNIQVAACEKVLVRPGGIPYDGMTWFRITTK